MNFIFRMPKCFKCAQSINDFKLFSTHIGHHALRSSPIMCAEEACQYKAEPQRTFSNLSNFFKHFKNAHQNTRNSASSNRIAPSSEAAPLVNPTSMEVDVASEEADVTPMEVATPPLNPHEASVSTPHISILREELDLHVSRLYYDYEIPRNKVQLVVGSTESLTSTLYSVLEPILRPRVEQCTDQAALKDLQEFLECLSNPFHGIHSEYTRVKTYIKDGTFIAPETCEIFQDILTFPESQLEVFTAQFVPLRKTLKAFLHEPGVMKKILDFKESLGSSPYIENFMNGDTFKNIEASFAKFLLPIFLASDDLCCTNPLGDSALVQKLTALYVHMPFLPTEYISSLNHILLLYLHNSSVKKKVSNKSLYAKVVDEFKYLADEGILVETEDFSGKVYFNLGLLTGDNLGIHEIAGFMKGFRANFPCRFCKVHLSVLLTQTRADPSLRRDKNNYDLDCEENNPSSTGIREVCIFHDDRDYFHCTNGTGCDIQHDVWEGTAVDDVKLIVEYFRSRDYFSLDFLNKRLQLFDYGPVDKSSKPRPLFLKEGKVKVKQSASHMITLTKYLGILMGDLIPEGHEVWRIYILLRKIVDIIMCPHIPKNMLPLLDSLIEQHHELFLKWSPKRRLKNKHHHMLHYSWSIENNGPLVHQWAMRMDARHRIGLGIARSISTWVNLPASIAFRNQLSFHSHLKSHSLLNFKFETGPSRPCIFPEMDIYNAIKDTIPEELQDGLLVSWVSTNGTEYKKDMVLVLGDSDFLPTLAKILKVIVQCTEIYFLCAKLKTEYFDEHFYAFKVSLILDSYVFVKYTDLPHPFPTYISQASSGELFVTYKYGL